jgi:hypothetical protein
MRRDERLLAGFGILLAVGSSAIAICRAPWLELPRLIAEAKSAQSHCLAMRALGRLSESFVLTDVEGPVTDTPGWESL